MIDFFKNIRIKKTLILILVMNTYSIFIILFGEKGDFLYDTTINLSFFITSSTFILSPLLIFAPRK